MLFGTIVYHTNTHRTVRRNRKLGNAGRIKLGTQSLRRIHANLLCSVCIFLFMRHMRIHPLYSLPKRSEKYVRDTGHESNGRSIGCRSCGN